MAKLPKLPAALAGSMSISWSRIRASVHPSIWASERPSIWTFKHMNIRASLQDLSIRLFKEYLSNRVLQHPSIFASDHLCRIWEFEHLRGVRTGRWKKLFWRRDPCFAAGPLPRRGSLNDRTDWEKRQLWKERTSPPKKVNFYKRFTIFKTRAKES